MIKLKTGVKLRGLSPQMNMGKDIAYEVYRYKGVPDMLITSACDGKHSKTSLHYSGNAIDLGISNVHNEKRESIVETLKTQLGDEFDVCGPPDPGHLDHIHIEWQPKRA